MSKLLTRILAFFPASGYKSRWLSYPVLLLLALLMVIYYGCTVGWFRYVGFDFLSYKNAIPTLLQGKLDMTRTPIYPMIFHSAMLLSEKVLPINWEIWVIALQFALYFLSAVYLGKLGCKLIKSPKVVFWMVAVYLLHPRLSQFGYLLQTDMIGMALTVFFLWIMLKRYPREMTTGDIVWFFVLMLVLVMLRPFFICFIPILGVYYVICLIKYKKSYLKSFVGVMLSLAVVCGIIWAYKREIHRLYGIHSLTDVSFNNNYYLTRLGDLPDPSLTDHPGLKAVLTEYKNKIEAGEIENDPLNIVAMWKEEGAVDRSCPKTVSEEYVNRMLEKHKNKLVSFVFTRFNQQVGPTYVFSENLFQNRWKHDLTGMINITFYMFFTLVGVCAVIFIRSWRRQRKLPEVYLLMLMITLGVIGASIIGAQYEWARLSLPAVPAWLLMFAMTISLFRLKRIPDRNLI